MKGGSLHCSTVKRNMKKKKAEEWEGLQFFFKVVREGLDEKMTFEQKDLQKKRE